MTTHDDMAQRARVAGLEFQVAHLSGELRDALRRLATLESAQSVVDALPTEPTAPTEQQRRHPVPSWLVALRSRLGEREQSGAGTNPWIAECLALVGLGQAGDETSWCSAAVAWSMSRSGQSIAGVTGAARSWLRWGAPLESPRLGCVTVLWRGSPSGWQGHVGLWLDEKPELVRLLGGNQANAVSESWYPRERILGYRWPA